MIDVGFLIAASINSLRPSDILWDCRPLLSLFQVMACHLCSAKPLLKPVMAFYQLAPQE